MLHSVQMHDFSGLVLVVLNFKIALIFSKYQSNLLSGLQVERAKFAID